MICGFLGSWGNFVSWISPWNVKKISKVFEFFDCPRYPHIPLLATCRTQSSFVPNYYRSQHNLFLFWVSMNMLINFHFHLEHPWQANWFTRPKNAPVVVFCKIATWATLMACFKWVHIELKKLIPLLCTVAGLSFVLD